MPFRRAPLALLTLAVSALIALAHHEMVPERSGPDVFARELADLRRREAHALPGSKEAYRIRERIEAIEEHDGDRGEHPRSDSPDEFTRILTGMRIPADRTEPEYAPGYLDREMKKAVLHAEEVQGPAALLPWVNRGPGNVSGRARGIVVDPDDASNDTWFIATVGGGVWKTADGGANWAWLTPDFPVLSTQSIAMAPSNHDVLYVGTGESYYNVDSIRGDGILKSTDRGVTWSHLLSTKANPDFENVSRILVDPTDPDYVLAATTRGRYTEYLSPRSGIHLSTDGGATWTEVYASTAIGSFGRVKKVQQLVADPTDFNVLFATVDEGGILKSTDRGLTWAFSNTGITDFSGRFELAVSPVDHLRIYASAEGAGGSQLWMSTNGGTTWAQTTGGSSSWLGAQGWYDNTIVCDPTNVNVVYVGGIYLWKITLSGTSRTVTYLGTGTHPDNHGLQIINAGGGWRILNTSDGGVAVSTTNDSGWYQTVDGMVTTQFYGVDKRPGGSAYVGGTQDNGTWQSPLDPTANTPWNFVIGGDGYETSWHFDDPQRLIGGYQYNGLMRSLDGGATWSSAITSVAPPGVIDNGAGNAPFITKIAKSQLNPERLCAVGAQGVWVSNDFAGTWSLSAIAGANWGSISTFHDVRISRANPDVIYAGSRMDANGHIMVSTDGGVTFNPTNDYATVVMGGISGLATDPSDDKIAYALFSFAHRPKILKTVDYGASWTDISGFGADTTSANGFPDVAVYDLTVFSDDPNHIWVGTEIGLVESTDGGTTWNLANNGLPNVNVWFLTEVEDQVVAGTHGRGIWSVTIPSLTANSTFNPLIEKAFQRPDGMIEVHLNLRSDYDSTTVFVDGSPAAMFGATTAGQMESVVVPVVSAGLKSIHAESWANNPAPYSSVTATVEAFAPQTPVLSYQNDFESPTSDFQGSLFTIGGTAGFSGSAIQSPHPYADGSNPVYMLTVPIIVAQSNALITFDEEVLVEPGDPGTVFGDSNFWDYVIVEGSKDGCVWSPLLDGYDCRAYADWESAYYSNSPSPAILHQRVIDLLNTFVVNDVILVRFRLFADGAVNGWGWIIDNLDIQGNAVSAVGPDVRVPQLRLGQNAPNPFFASTTISYALPAEQPVSLSVFDLQGRLVKELVSGSQPAGEHVITWDGRDRAGRLTANGVYFYRMDTAGKTLKKKMIVTR